MKKTSQNHVRQQKSCQRNEYLGSTPCKIFRTILKMDKERIQKNGLNDKEINDYALQLRRDSM